jgi:hypothetical protein
MKKSVKQLIQEKFGKKNVRFLGQIDYNKAYVSVEGSVHNFNCSKVDLYAYYHGEGFKELHIFWMYITHHKFIFDSDRPLKMVRELCNGKEAFFVVHKFGEQDNKKWDYLEVYTP